MTNRKRGSGKMSLPPTPRDQEIIRAVMRHGHMIREQVRRLYFRNNGRLSSVQAACRRLKILTERGYLTRLRLPVTQGSGPYVYQPGRQAAVILNAEDSKWLGRGVRSRRVDSVSGLYHGLEIVDFYIAVKEGTEARGGRIVTWLGEAEARYSFSWRGRRLVFSPDAYCLWALPMEEGAFFLEWDRGTESMSRLSQKLDCYDGYYQLRLHHDHLGEIGLRPRLLIVVPDERREQKVVRWLARKLEKGQLHSLPTILVSTRYPVLQDALEPIWCKPGQEQRARFVD